MKIIFPFSVFCAVSFCSRADSWTQKKDYPAPVGDAVSFSINGKGYVGTGCCYRKDFYEYDPVSDTWTQKADLPGVGRTSAVGFAIGDKGYIGPGQDSDSTNTHEFWEYDPVTNYWTEKAIFQGDERQEAFAFAIAGNGYVGTGYLDPNLLDDFWKYSQLTDAWSKKTVFQGGPRVGAVGFSIGDKGYVGMGLTDFAYQDDLWEYDPATNAWSQKSDFGTIGRATGVAFSINGLGYVGLGATHDGSWIYLHDLWQYNPSTNSWVQKTNFPGGAGIAAIAFVIDNKAYVGTGSSPGTSGTDFWEYTPDSTGTLVEEQVVNKTKLTISPNPIINSSTISFYLNKHSSTTLDLLESSGRKIKTLLDANTEAGTHELQLNREQLSAGIYFLQVKMNDETLVMKIVIQ